MAPGFWRGRRVVITAGPTREYLDPVRYLSNESSGTMGWALAEAARNAGARVTLLTGPTGRPAPKGVKQVPFISARDLLRAGRRAIQGADTLIGAAAVADWRPARYSASKIKSDKKTTLRLIPNPDVLADLGKRMAPGALRAGFALETTRLIDRARKKMRAKNLDLIIANPPSSLGGRRTTAWLLTRTNAPRRYVGSKTGLARLILNLLENPHRAPR